MNQAIVNYQTSAENTEVENNNDDNPKAQPIANQIVGPNQAVESR